MQHANDSVVENAPFQPYTAAARHQSQIRPEMQVQPPPAGPIAVILGVTPFAAIVEHRIVQQEGWRLSTRSASLLYAAALETNTYCC